MKAKVLPGGLTAKPINPYGEEMPPDNWTRGDDAIMADAEERQEISTMKAYYYGWLEFEKNNPPLPLTTQQPENEVIECEEITQWADEDADYFIGWSEKKFNTRSRKALKPIVQPITTKGSPTLDEMVAHTMGRMPSLDGLKVVSTPSQSGSVEMQIIDRVKHEVDNGSGGDHVSDYFVKIVKGYSGNPHVEVRHYENSNDRLSLLKVDDKTVASVIETRTEFNHVEFVFAQWQQANSRQEVILEALQSAKTELEMYIPVTDVTVLDKIESAINQLTNGK